MNTNHSRCIQPHKIAAALHDYRISRGLSLYDLQKRTNIHRIILYAFEHNRLEPFASDLYAICKSFCVPIDDLFACAKGISEPILYDEELNTYLIESHEDPLLGNEDTLIYEFLAPILCNFDSNKVTTKKKNNAVPPQ